MKKFLLLLIIPVLSFGQFDGVFISKNHSKSKGFNFKIKNPAGFQQMETDRPNIIQKWVKNQTNNDKIDVEIVN